jgi:hypothetical protein
MKFCHLLAFLKLKILQQDEGIPKPKDHMGKTRRPNPGEKRWLCTKDRRQPARVCSTPRNMDGRLHVLGCCTSFQPEKTPGECGPTKQWRHPWMGEIVKSRKGKF